MAPAPTNKPVVVVVLGGINMDLATVEARFPESGETVVGEPESRS